MSSSPFKILVADNVSDSGLQPLHDAGFGMDKRVGLNAIELRDVIAAYNGLIVRSETKVTADLMDAATKLRVVGRAGVGVDNIDVPAATARGIVVMNAPDGNTITTAEHTVALLIALTRRVPQANSSLKSGKWDRKSFVGVELQGKTLGVVGLGRIGRIVALRARAFGMRIVAFDPFIAAEQARDLEIELAPLERVFAEADFLTVHTPLTPETRGIIGKDAFATMKKGVRIVNCARGGLVDEAALYDAIQSGIVAGAALDVFTGWPPMARFCARTKPNWICSVTNATNMWAITSVNFTWMPRLLRTSSRACRVARSFRTRKRACAAKMDQSFMRESTPACIAKTDGSFTLAASRATSRRESAPKPAWPCSMQLRGYFPNHTALLTVRAKSCRPRAIVSTGKSGPCGALIGPRTCCA